jgi:hypothetical protein
MNILADGGVVKTLGNEGAKQSRSSVFHSPLIVALAMLLMILASPRPGAAAGFQVLFSFGVNTSGFGAMPVGNLIFRNGKLYGTTESDGTFENGTAYSLTPPAIAGQSWTETVLYNFGNPAIADGRAPLSGLTSGPDGALYGGLAFGAAGNGAIYSLTPPVTAGEAWTETLLHTFTGGADGAFPFGLVGLSKSGFIFGTTSQGGKHNAGTAFALPRAGGSDKIIYSFAGSPDGADPGSLLSRQGVYFGATGGGGSATCQCGTVFQLTPPRIGGSWKETVLHSFDGTDGQNPSGLAVDSNGVLYGTTITGGIYGSGNVFSLTPPSTPGGAWTETNLYTFTGGSDGGFPAAGVVIGSNGVLYGTTEGNVDLGNVYSLTPPATAGGQWTETVLHIFTGADGSTITAGLTQVDGVLYGIAVSGGTFNGGTAFVVTP